MTKEILIRIDKNNFNFPGVEPPTEEEVTEAIRSELEGYTGAGAGPKGKFWVGVNAEIIELPPRPQDEGEPPTPPEVLKTFNILAPPGSPPEQTAAAMEMAARLGQAKGSK